MKKILLSFLISMLHLGIFAQDVNVILPHYLSSRHLNPAFTGLHKNRYRLSLRAQDDWLKSAKPDFYNYYQVSGEMKIIGWEKDQLSAGIEARHSFLGTAGFSTTTGVLSMAYTRQLSGKPGKKTGHFLSMGAEYGFGQNIVNSGSLLFGDQFDPATGEPTGNPTQEANGQFQAIYGDLNTGLLWYWLEENRFELSAGVGVYHLNRPDISLLGNEVSLYMRWNGFLMAGVNLYPSVVLEPGLIAHWQGPHSTMFGGTNIRFGRAEEDNFSFKTGLWLQGNSIDGQFNISYLHLLLSLGLPKTDVSLGYGLNMVLPGALIQDLRGLSLSMQYYFGKENQKYALVCPGF